MNIFVLHENPAIAAQMACDKHVVKMSLESAQLLCSSHPVGKAPYKRTHYNHPCSIWCRASKSNYLWLVEHGLALCDEYGFRYDKIHKCRKIITWCENNNDHLSDLGLTTFALAMPDEYKTEDGVESYRNYYLGAKVKLLRYTKREPPDWIPKELLK